MSACGTYAGYNKHNREHTPICDECRAARNAYMRDYRAKNPVMVEWDHERAVARARALSKLANKYPGVYARLLEQEMAS